MKFRETRAKLVRQGGLLWFNASTFEGFESHNLADRTRRLRVLGCLGFRAVPSSDS